MNATDRRLLQDVHAVAEAAIPGAARLTAGTEALYTYLSRLSEADRAMLSAACRVEDVRDLSRQPARLRRRLSLALSKGA